MLTLLYVVVLCGIGAWVVLSTNIPQPWKNIILAILAVIVVVVFFGAVLGVNTHIPIR
jgi:hypothetical protein